MVDNIINITKVISDKTGTITKNEMELSDISFANDEIVYTIDGNFPKDIVTEDKLNLLRCISICIHFEDNQFKTVEDKTIREKSMLNM